MAINNSRSMNEQLHRGATDGSVRNMRPDSSAADYTHAEQRARLLHPSHYGSFGDRSDLLSTFTEGARPDSSSREAKRNLGVRDY